MLEILLVVALEVTVPVECPDVLAVGAGRTFEQCELVVALLLRSENPDRHRSALELAGENQKVCRQRMSTGAGSRRGTVYLEEKRGARYGLRGRAKLYRINDVTIAPGCDNNSVRNRRVLRSERGQ